ncbi:MAG: hypothetical protein Q6K90_08475, partial [Gloeomargarita sp. HHBFW_bins_162]
MTQEVVAVLGGGMWGSLLAHLIRENGYPVRVWSRRQGGDIHPVVESATILVVAVSIAGVMPVIEAVNSLAPEVIIVSTTKGLLPNSFSTPAQMWQKRFPQHGVVALSGPNLAAEIAQGLPAATVAASVQTEAAQRV